MLSRPLTIESYNKGAISGYNGRKKEYPALMSQERTALKLLLVVSMSMNFKEV